MIYELWVEDDSSILTYSFFPQNADDARDFLSSQARLIWTTNAKNFTDACTARNEHLGWDDYKPWAQ